jgi:acetyl-CoA C-acetyltransferase
MLINWRQNRGKHMSDPIVIVAAKRTAMGGFQGVMASQSAPQLGGVAIKAALAESGVAGDAVDQAIMGCCLFAGLGQAPARQAARGAGLPDSVGATTISKMCGSGLKAVMDAHDQLMAGSADIMIAGGMESMTNAPYLLPKGRGGYRMGHGEVKDHMFLDGLEDAYDKGRAMGTFAEDTARQYQFTREAQDAYAVESLMRAQRAISSGAFADEIAAVETGKEMVLTDEQPGKAKLDKIPLLKPAFAKDGTVTAANSSSISDGAAAVVLTRQSVAKAHGLTPIAVIKGHSFHAQAPAWFSTAPGPAIKKLLAKTGWQPSDVDLWEINEAFAVVAMAAMRDVGIDHAKMNINGGACALGHPIGASGARVLVTLLNALKRQNKATGVASLCIGGGEAVALAVERL